VNRFLNKEQEATIGQFEEQLQKECDDYFKNIKLHILKVSKSKLTPKLPRGDRESVVAFSE